jgi:tRNA(fMet)-specific endonuclease VapC
MTACLDSSAYIAMIRGNRSVADSLSRFGEIIVPAAVVAELTEGFYAARDPGAQSLALGRFIDRENVRFCPATYAVAARYGFLSRQLRLKGTPLPVNDVWIAATALEEGEFAIVSYDRHFDEFGLIPRIAP